MTEALDQLVDSLLYEGYALYPYTPGAAKNATPTPFGIVYPPVYASECAGAFDRARLECVAEPAAGAALSATLRYLILTGERHEAADQRVELRSGSRGRARHGRAPRRAPHAALGGARGRPHAGALLRAQHARGGGGAEPRRGARAIAALGAAAGPDLARAGSSRRSRPTARASTPTRCWPASATMSILGATIVLPDHPQIAPESRGGLFDSTEIEEALLLHVQALSDGERAEIEQADPAVREMIERAAARHPRGDHRPARAREVARCADAASPPRRRPACPTPAGEPEATVDGVRFVAGRGT